MTDGHRIILHIYESYKILMTQKRARKKRKHTGYGCTHHGRYFIPGVFGLGRCLQALFHLCYHWSFRPVVELPTGASTSGTKKLCCHKHPLPDSIDDEILILLQRSLLYVEMTARRQPNQMPPAAISPPDAWKSFSVSKFVTAWLR
jgi:hypothetical protein